MAKRAVWLMAMIWMTAGFALAKGPIDTDKPVAIGSWSESVCALAAGYYVAGKSPRSAEFTVDGLFCSGMITDRGLLTAKHCFDLIAGKEEEADEGTHAVLGVCCGKTICRNTADFTVVERANFVTTREAASEEFDEGVVTAADQGYLHSPSLNAAAALTILATRAEVDRVAAGNKCVTVGYGPQAPLECLEKTAGECVSKKSREPGERVAGKVSVTPYARVIAIDPAIAKEAGVKAAAGRRLLFYEGSSTRLVFGDSGGPTVCEDPAKPGVRHLVASSVAGSGKHPSLKKVWSITSPIHADKEFPVTLHYEAVQPAPAR